MPLFRYTVTNNQGRQLSGVMDASNDRDVYNRLINRGFRVDSIVPAAAQPAKVPAPGYTAAAQTSAPDKTSGLTATGADMAVFFRTIASYLKAGMNVFQALHEVSVHSSSYNIRVIAARMSGHVQAGGSLSDTMKEFPKAFPDHVVGVVAAGELGGFLAIVTDEIAKDYELAQRSSNRLVNFFVKFLWINAIGSVFLAPILPIFFKVYGKAFSSSGVVPSASEMLREVGMKCLVYTLTKTLPIMLVLVGGYHITAAILRHPKYRETVHRWMLKVPKLGKASLHRSLAGFSGILWRLHEAGVSPVFSWSAASLAAENLYVARCLDAQSNYIRSGGTFSDALSATGLFSDDDQLLIRVAEKSGDTAGALERMAEFYRDAASTAMGQVKWIMLRIAIIAMLIGLGVFLIGSSMYLTSLVDAMDNAWLVGE